MKKTEKAYRCSCCNNMINNGKGALLPWDNTGDTSVLTCKSCVNEIIDSETLYVLDYITDINEKAMEELRTGKSIAKLRGK